MAGNVHSVAEPTAVSASKVFADMFVVDADSHWSEPADLFTSRAPAEVRDRVPQVQEVDGQLVWVFDGHVVGRFSAAGVIGRDEAQGERTRR